MKVKFTDSQLKQLSNIFIVVGEVLFATVVIPFFFGVDKPQLDKVLSGVILTYISWVLSLYVVRKTKR